MINEYLSKFNIILYAFTVCCMHASCSVITVLKVDSPSSNCAASGQSFCNTKKVTASIWSGRTGKKDLSSLCDNGISRVKVTTKPPDVFLGFITLGFVVRQRIEWDCAQRSGSGDIP